MQGPPEGRASGRLTSCVDCELANLTLNCTTMVSNYYVIIGAIVASWCLQKICSRINFESTTRVGLVYGSGNLSDSTDPRRSVLYNMNINELTITLLFLKLRAYVFIIYSSIHFRNVQEPWTTRRKLAIPSLRPDHLPIGPTHPIVLSTLHPRLSTSSERSHCLSSHTRP